MTYGRTVGVSAVLTVVATGSALAWGLDGHRMISRAAADGLTDMPSFFLDSAEQLAYLGPEPDRWRDDELSIMDEAWKYDHYIDLENVPAGALDAPDRYQFVEALHAAGVEQPAETVGFLPYRIEELYQRLAKGFARWRRTETEPERTWIEERIINDAGILGHYVADAANPHHTTIHFNGWADSAPNPEGYTTSNDFHWRFESQFVDARVEYDDLRAAIPTELDAVADVRAAVLSYIAETHEGVVPMYELEKAFGFDPESAAPETRAFVVQRMRAGATMLRTLWYGAWVESAEIAARQEP